MARGSIVSAQSRTTSTLLSTLVARLSLSSVKCRIPFTRSQYLPSIRLFCKCSHAHAVEYLTDMTKYREAFSRRMAMAGLKPHHRIALGVSGGPDSMALCVLTAGWKTGGFNQNGEAGEFIDGLLAITVDHGLREESKEEANIVSHRVSDMGIRCEIVRCDWLDGRPKQGHLQEAARDMRYRLFQKVCIQHQIGVLLIAHHADDQAELFILRLSRNSGVLGLAGMAFSSQIFSSYAYSCHDDLKNHSILLVRPLLDFSKDDMYKICQGGNRDWVEDPTNRSPLFVRNRIRMSLGDLSSCSFKSELQAVISACRRTRSYVEHVCSNLINEAVTVMDQGYAVIDLEILNPSKIEDIFLSKFLALVLQTSLTAAGCYLCPTPGSRGTKALVCSSIDGPLPSKLELFQIHSDGEQRHCVTDVEQILEDAKSYSNHLIQDASDKLLLSMISDSVPTEAKRFNMLSESTYKNILLLQREEIKRFKLDSEVTSDSQLMHAVECVGTYPSIPLQPGQVCYFMNRFFVTWKLSKENGSRAFPREVHNDGGLGEDSWDEYCSSCLVGDEMVAELRHMIESDWLYLAKLSKGLSSGNLPLERVFIDEKTGQKVEKTNLCADYGRLSAKRAILSLKSIPVAARRSLPVLVSSHGQLLSIPVS
ncbi:tRNA(Ile)-2-lysyl-cytidine synthase [Citrus sinensis]|uniref:tRNA(Ile)-2-lysyl-cytidine synthase n=1 Tax=Citrus sinensis TaxID=2711 RepID=A0ACB8NSM9_CITSI|nr:tRNA(Ile)-2-lysyl-cytidine synthase [Citrus sinensis]